MNTMHSFEVEIATANGIKRTLPRKQLIENFCMSKISKVRTEGAISSRNALFRQKRT